MPKTRYENLVDRIKDSRLAAPFLFVAVCLGATFSFWDSASNFYKNTIQKEASPSPFRATYRDIRGHALSMLVSGQLEEPLEKHIGARPIILKNEVFDQIFYMQKNFSKALDTPEWVVYFDETDFNHGMEGNSSKLVSNSALGRKYLGLTFEPTGGGTPLDTSLIFPDGNFDFSWHLTLHGSPFDPDRKSLKKSLPQGIMSASQVTFRREIEPEEMIQMLDAEDGDLLKHLTRNGFPDSFNFYIKMTSRECSGWEIQHVFPRLSARILVIENITEKPVSIEELSGEFFPQIGLLDKPSGKVQAISKKFSGLFLKPSEAMIVPVSIFMDWEEGAMATWTDKDFEVEGKVPFSQIERENDFREYITIVEAFDDPMYYFQCDNNSKCEMRDLPDDEKVDFFKVPSKLFAGDFSEPKSEESVFYYSSLELSEISINGRRYDIHKDSGENIFISHGYGFGSCPYIATQSGKLLGSFLTGRKSKEKEGIYVKKVPERERSFVLSELEKEVSYIKSSPMFCTDRHGNTSRIQPEQEILRETNQDYLVLEQGDSFLLTFSNKGGVDKQCEIHFFGFYVPLKN